MELLFNELSITSLSPDKYLANDKMKLFAETVSVARKKGFANIRSHHATDEITLSENYSLHDWLNNKDVADDYRSFLYGMIILPFIKDDDEEVESKYVESNYFFEHNESKIAKTQCLGLASAYLYETLSISLTSLPVWRKPKLPIIIETTEQITTDDVFNVATKESFNDAALAAFVESLGEINLVQTDISPDDKKFHISPHHGTKELTYFWNRLKRSPYVVEMRSTDWGGKRFIRKVERTGVVEIVLTESQRQYAMWVQTTGSNLRVTKAIAEILENEFS